ncbi:flippase-like domain-containing protein [Candidatus Micrarchaeota archaeon]|nr:flippase-like domain-containing protein [Candidatus Micrarchaeota archaeon]
MNLKGAFWLAAGILLVGAILSFTDPSQLARVRLPFFAAAVLAFLLSTVLWGVAWGVLAGISPQRAVRINTASLAGVFAPAGLGGDALRAHLLPESAPRALAASFITKSLKLVFTSAFLAVAMLLLSTYRQFSLYLPVYLAALAFTLFAAVAFVSPAILPGPFSWLSRKLLSGRGENFVGEFRRLLHSRGVSRIGAALLLLLVSSLLEFAAVYLTLYSAGAVEEVVKAFVFSSFINSLALITITPQGIGFVEGGGYLMLTANYWAVSPKFVGIFLIAWNLVRFWIPTIVGSVFLFRQKSRKMKKW